MPVSVLRVPKGPIGAGVQRGLGRRAGSEDGVRTARHRGTPGWLRALHSWSVPRSLANNGVDTDSQRPFGWARVPEADPWVLAVIATPDSVEVLIIRFANHMVTENVQVFWAELQRGEFICGAHSSTRTWVERSRSMLISSATSRRPRVGIFFSVRFATSIVKDRQPPDFITSVTMHRIAPLDSRPTTLSTAT